MAKKDGKKAGFVSKQVLKAFNSKLPPLKQAEKEALASGTAGWDTEIYSGSPNWKMLWDLPKPSFTKEEQDFMDGPVEELCSMLDDWKISQSDEQDIPEHVWDHLKKHKFLGMVIPKEYGGLGFSALAHSQVVMKIASRGFAGAINTMVPNSLGPGELLTHYGSETQKKKWLPRLAKGQEIPCFALTEPKAGSDATSIQTTGTVVRDKKTGKVSIKIDNIDKRYITLAPIATLVGLAFQLKDPENILGKGTEPGITVGLLPRNTPGLIIGNRHKPMDIAFQNGPIKGSVEIGVDDVLGELDGVGKGWPMLCEQLAVGRSISLPAVSTAGGKFVSRTISDYTRIRRQFNYPIGMFEGVEEPMARIAGMTYIADAARTATAQMVDRGEKPTIPSAILKYHLTNNMRTVVTDGMDILGGKGVMNGPQNFLSRFYKAVPIAITVEGANIMTRNLIIGGQGGVVSHPYMPKELMAASQSDKDKAAAELFDLVKGHIGQIGANKFRSLGFTFNKIPDCDPQTKKYYKKINRLSASFNLAANTSLALIGGDLKRKERLSARLGDVMSNLYLCSTVLRHYEVNGRNKEDLPLVHWACTYTLNQASEAMHELLRNYPSKTAAVGLRTLTMPRLRGVGRTTDKMDRAAAQVIYNPGAARDRLTSGIYLPGHNQKLDPVFRLEDAFNKTVATEPLEKKLREAIKAGKLEEAPFKVMVSEAVKAGVINQNEGQKLVDAEDARDLVINVDDFEVEQEEAEPKQAQVQQVKNVPAPKLDKKP